MKKIHITIVGLLFCFISVAQLPVAPLDLDKKIDIDKVNYLITYKVNIIHNPQKPKEITKDIVSLEIGAKYSKDYSRLLYQADSTATSLCKKGVRNVPLFQEPVPPIVVYKQYPMGYNTVQYRTFMGGPTLEYKEKVPNFKWEIKNEKKKILGYLCQKAITTFRGRNYEAWFTSKIPLSEGPYKFGGLPGLILEIYDVAKHYTFSCIGIQKGKQEKSIVFWEWNTLKTTREKLNKTIKRMYKNPISFIKSTQKGVEIRDGNTDKEVKELSYPYNPIELE